MSSVFEDIKNMHDHFGHRARVAAMTPDELNAFYALRLTMLDEEMGELYDATEPEDVVDAIIDLMVFAVGTLDAFGVDGQAAWDAVHAANMAKKSGIKPGRPNPLGLPDLIKPEGWVAPTHAGNHGTLTPDIIKMGHHG